MDLLHANLCDENVLILFMSICRQQRSCFFIAWVVLHRGGQELVMLEMECLQGPLLRLFHE